MVKSWTIGKSKSSIEKSKSSVEKVLLQLKKMLKHLAADNGMESNYWEFLMHCHWIKSQEDGRMYAIVVEKILNSLLFIL